MRKVICSTCGAPVELETHESKATSFQCAQHRPAAAAADPAKTPGKKGGPPKALRTRAGDAPKPPTTRPAPRA